MSIMWHVKYNPRMRKWLVYDENWYYIAGYDTHAEALAYADRMSRTVEEELPKVRHLLQGTHYRVVSSRDWTDFHWEGSDDFVSIPSHDRHRIAMHLLALHYHHERNQK